MLLRRHCDVLHQSHFLDHLLEPTSRGRLRGLRLHRESTRSEVVPHWERSAREEIRHHHRADEFIATGHLKPRLHIAFVMFIECRQLIIRVVHHFLLTGRIDSGLGQDHRLV